MVLVFDWDVTKSDTGQIIGFEPDCIGNLSAADFRDLSAAIQPPVLRVEPCHDVIGVDIAVNVVVNGRVGAASGRFKGVDEQILSRRAEFLRMLID